MEGAVELPRDSSSTREAELSQIRSLARPPSGLKEGLPLPADAELKNFPRSGPFKDSEPVGISNLNDQAESLGFETLSQCSNPSQPKKVVRMIEYWNEASLETILREEMEGKEIEKQVRDRAGLEIVNIALTSMEKKDSLHLPHGGELESKPGTPKKLPPVRMMHTSYMRIRAPVILNALNHVVNYYPASSLSGDTITIYAPYSVLVHHEQKLREFRDTIASQQEEEDPSQECENEDGVEYLDHLLSAVSEYHGNRIEQERERHRRDTPMCTYDMLWLLFEPGTDVYLDVANDNDYNPFVIKRVDFGHHNDKIATDYTITLWNLDSSMVEVGPSETIKTIERFDGEKSITSLRLFPCRFSLGQGDLTPEKYRQRFIDRGRKFFDLQMRKCMWFNGMSYYYPRRKYSGYVMVDPDEYYRVSNAGDAAVEPIPLLAKGVDNLTGIGQKCTCLRCLKLFGDHVRKPKFAGYSGIHPLKTKEMTEHQYFLCQRYVHAFVLRIRDWKRLDVAGFSDPMFDGTMYDDLILPQDSKRMIDHLTKTYFDDLSKENMELSQEPQSIDPLEGKGQGLIFLLHGKPGVGKTYTAECISQRLARPLLALSVADIGTDPSMIEKSLEQYFKMARQWGALLLIDEADVYLEDREVTDLDRNSIVATFLRAMEYYQGVLFLTTNRVGTFDEAILSRVNLMVGYHDFTEDDRHELWTTLFRRLAREKEDTLRLHAAAKSYVLEESEIISVQWNGREIRNAFQTAIGLATAEEDRDKNGLILIKEEHFQSVVRMSKAFKDYIRAMSGGKSEAQVARIKGKR